MKFTLNGIDYDLGIKDEVAAIQAFSIELANFIAQNIGYAEDTFDITQQAANALKLDGKPVFDDATFKAVDGEISLGSFPAFYDLISQWDNMEVEDIEFVEALFKECVAFIEKRYDREIHIEEDDYTGFVNV